jgi:hypothetical protein
MPFSYNETRSLAAPLSAPIQIGENDGGLWYFPRGTRQQGFSTTYTGQYNVAAMPLSFSRDVTINQWRMPYIQGANSAAFTAVGAGAIMFRGAIYEADTNGVPQILVGDMGYATYVPGVDSVQGIVGVASFPAPISLQANKQYFLHFVASAVTLSAGVPNTILAADTFDLIATPTSFIPALDPMASVGISDADFPFNSSGAAGYYLEDALNATTGAGNALDAFPATLRPFGTGVYLTSTAFVVAVRTED